MAQRNLVSSQACSHWLALTRVCLFLLLFTPLVFWKDLMFYYASTKVHFVLLVTELALGFFIWANWKRNQWRFRMTVVGKAILIFVVVGVVASFLGIDPFFSFWSDLDRALGIMMWLHLGAIFLMLHSLLKTPQDWVRVFIVSTIVALLVAFLHLLSNTTIDTLINENSGSTLGNSTFLGAYLLFQIFFAVFLIFAAQTRRVRIFAICASLVLSVSLWSVPANAAQLSFLGGVILLGSLFLIRLGATRWVRSIGYSMLGGLMIAFVSVVILAFQPQSGVHSKFVELSSESRFVVWDSAWQAIKERPLLGWGLENTERALVKHYNPCQLSAACGGEISFDSAHNILLDVAIETGLLGLFAYLSIFAAAVFHLWRPRTAIKHRYAAPVLTSALLVYFVQNLTGLDTVTSLLFFVILLAAISVLGNDAARAAEPVIDKNNGRSGFTTSLLASVTLVAAAFFFVIQPIQANRLTLLAVAPQPMEQHLQDYRRAAWLSPVGIDRRRTFLAHSTSKLLWETPPQSLQAIKTFAFEETEMARLALLDTLNRTPHNLQVALALGELTQVETRLFDAELFSLARETLQQAIEQNPRHQAPKWALASVYLEQGKFDEAVALTQEALALDPRVQKAHELHIIASKFFGDEELLRQAVDRARLAHPTQVMEQQINDILSSEDTDKAMWALLHRFYLLL